MIYLSDQRGYVMAELSQDVFKVREHGRVVKCPLALGLDGLGVTSKYHSFNGRVLVILSQF